MISSSEILLIVFVVFIIILGVVILSVLLISVEGDVVVTEPPCDQGTTGLEDVSGTPCYKDFNDNCRLIRYSSTILNGSYLYPYPTPYEQICQNECIGYVDSNGACCASGDPVCKGLVTDYNNCISTLAPMNCQGVALPVAVDSGTLFYVGLIAGNISPGPCVCSSIT